MNRLYLFVCISLMASCFAFGQARQVHSLDGEWLFAVDESGIGFDEGWQKGIASQSARKVNVPHTWNIETGTEDYAGLAWYEKSLTIPGEWKDKNVRIRFGAVYHDAYVYVNGQKVGENLSAGYTPFTVDITEFVSFAASNKVVVAVSNAFSKDNFPYERAFDWANDGGIIRSVDLEVTGKPSLRYVHVGPLLDIEERAGKAKIAVKLWEEDIERVTLSFVLKDKATGEVVHSETKTLDSDEGKFSAQIDLGTVKLWHFDSPNLYELETAVISEYGRSDERVSTFGFRELKIEGDDFYLNGEVVRLPGIEYMPGSSPEYGMAEPKHFIESVVRAMKDLNVCITRFHWPQDEYMISLMDEYGILVQEELPWWQRPARLTPSLIDAAEKQLGDMIDAHYNHASVFSWGISNEVNGDTEKDIYLQLGDYVRALDPNRFVTVMSNRIWQKEKNDETLLFDIPTWNEYIGTWHGKDRTELPRKLETVKGALNGRPLLITENGLSEPANAGGDARRIDDMLYHIGHWVKEPHIIGYIYFCLSDYRTHMGEEGFGKYRIRRHGVTDVELNPKPSYSVFKQLASPIDITALERIDETSAKVEIRVKDEIPSYALRGYAVGYNDRNGDPVEIPLPTLNPGDVYSTELPAINARFSFRIARPGGFSVIEY